MLNRIFSQIRTREFVFALFFYMFIASAISYMILALVLAAENIPNLSPMAGGLAGMIAGLIIVFILNLIKMRTFSLHMAAFNLHPISSWFNVLVFGIIIWMSTIYIQFSPYLNDLKTLMDNWSVLLLIIGTIASIGGLYLTARSIQQYRRQITSFSVFANRLTCMLRETSGDTDNDYVRIMAYTPIPGSLALEERIYNTLKDEMMGPNSRLEIVCLNPNDLSTWFDKFIGKPSRSGVVNETKILIAKRDIENLISQVDNPAFSEKMKFAPDHKSIRLSADELPGYYFFFTDTSAVF